MKAQITITVQDDESIEVDGPLDNKILVYGMLEVARDVVMQHHAKIAMQAAMEREAKRRSGIVAATAPMPPEVLRRLHGR